jgi:SapC
MNPGIRFSLPPDVSGTSPEARWRNVLDYGWLDELGIMPVADRELLNMAHHTPLVVVLGAGEPSVQALVRSDLLLQSPVDKQGRWRPAYRPLALRALPLLLLDPAGDTMRTALITGIAESRLGPPLPYLDPTGARRPEVAAALGQLTHLRSGAKALAAAAETLLGAGLLAKLGVEGEAAQFFSSMELMVPDAAKLAALAPTQTAALARDGRLALDLLTASHFSSRLLNSRARRTAEKPVPATSCLSLDLDAAPVEIDAPGLGLDQSALFSIEDFLAAGGGKVTRDPGRDLPRRITG